MLFDIFKKKTKPVDNKYVFDKAKYHDNSIEQLGLDEEQAFVHTGLFFAWLVNNGLMSDFFIQEAGSEIEKLKHRKISPSTIYMNWDGVLLGEMLNSKGFNFAMNYFDFDKGTYIKDYENVFSVNAEQFFTVKDNWDNYDKVRPVIDAAYENWSRQTY
jgi:hypothetical protein